MHVHNIRDFSISHSSVEDVDIINVSLHLCDTPKHINIGGVKLFHYA